MFREKMQELMWDAKTNKELASEQDGAIVARHWAVLHTELEKVLAYYIAYLEPKESE